MGKTTPPTITTLDLTVTVKATPNLTTPETATPTIIAPATLRATAISVAAVVDSTVTLPIQLITRRVLATLARSQEALETRAAEMAKISSQRRQADTQMLPATSRKTTKMEERTIRRTRREVITTVVAKVPRTSSTSSSTRPRFAGITSLKSDAVLVTHVRLLTAI